MEEGEFVEEEKEEEARADQLFHARTCPGAHRMNKCSSCELEYCERCREGCSHDNDKWRSVIVSFETGGGRRHWAVRSAEFSALVTRRGGGRRVMDHARTISTGCVHASRGDRAIPAARQQAIRDHRDSLNIDPLDAGLDFSDARCAHDIGQAAGVDPRNAKRRDRTLLKHCLRRVAPLWTCMSAHERTSIPVELVEKISEKVASAGYGAE